MNYNAIGQAMYARNASTPTIPSWLIVDANHRRKYPFFVAPPGRTPAEWISSGYMKKAGSIRALAEACGIDPDELGLTVERFNAMVRAGRDDDFHRGESRYEHYFGDPRNRPNPSLGTVERPPFYAVSVVPGDIGTCGGLVTDRDARVLGQDGRPIPGLYATGNITSPIGAGKYWGAGASIGSSMTFGYVAARHAAAL
jgi:3-oxosteroid 1-dehydrogenase